MISPLRFNNKGFSFLAVVMLLFAAVLAATVIFIAINPTRSTAALKQTADKARLLRIALADFRKNHGGASGAWPTSLGYLTATDGGAACAFDNTITSPTYLTLQGWCGPYVDVVFSNLPNDFQTDGWGINFTFSSSTGVLTSCGPDLTCGTSDDITY